MDKIYSYLLDWAINLIKNRDILAKKVNEIEKGGNGFDLTVKHNDGKEIFFMVLNEDEVHPSYDVGIWTNTPLVKILENNI